MELSKVTFDAEGDGVRIKMEKPFKVGPNGEATGVLSREEVVRLYAWLGGVLKR